MGRDIYQAPWRAQLEGGKLSEYYGPSSPAAYARAMKRHENWAWRKPGYTGPSDAEQVCGFMRDEQGRLRQDVPPGERRVYLDIYEAGHSIGWVTRELGLSRSTVKSYLRRLRERVAKGSESTG